MDLGVPMANDRFETVSSDEVDAALNNDKMNHSSKFLSTFSQKLTMNFVFWGIRQRPIRWMYKSLERVHFLTERQGRTWWWLRWLLSVVQALWDGSRDGLGRNNQLSGVSFAPNVSGAAVCQSTMLNSGIEIH